MKNRFFARSCLLIGIVVGLWMCSKEPTVTPIGSKEPLYSVAKARNFYDHASTTTRAIAEQGPMTPGAYSLDWEQAEVSLDSLLSSVDVPIEMQYRYYRYLQPEPDSVLLTPIYSKMVVVKEHPTLLEGCYIRHLIPSRTMLREQPEFDYDALLNSRPKQGFSGVSLYTDLNGWPMCIGYYYEGELLVDAFLFDRAYSLEENIARLSDLLGDLAVARCTKVETRATETNQDDQEPIDIDEVVVSETWQDYLDRLLTELEFQNLHMHDLPNPGIGGSGEGPTNGGGGGSGSSSSNDGTGEGDEYTSDHNSKIEYEDEETKELIEPLLDSISQDCMGKTLLDLLDGVTIKTHAYNKSTNYNYFDPDTNTIHLEEHRSYGFRYYILLEELIHRFQIQQQGVLSIGKQLNNEIEAKVGWMLERKRNLVSSYEGAIANAFVNEETLNAIYTLGDHFIAGTNPYMQDYQDAYTTAINGLRMLRGYKDMTISHLIEDWQFSTLLTLMTDCPEFNQ